MTTSPLTASAQDVSNQPTPFDCSRSTTFVAQAPLSGNTTLYDLVAGSGSSTFTAVGGSSGVSYNAIGYNTADNLIYGDATYTGDGAHNELITVDATGTVRNVAPLSFAANNGAVDGGVYYAMQSGTKVLHRVDLGTHADSPITLSAIPNSADFTFVGGLLWGDHGTSPNGSLTRINVSTGQVSFFNSPVPSSINAGAAWTFANGNLGLSDNATGAIAQVAIANPGSATPAFTLVSVAPGPASFNNDGTSCAGLPADLGLSKTVNPTIINPGHAITWTLTVTNHGPGDSTGYVVTDHIPSSVTNVSTTSPGCAVSGNDLTCHEGLLLNGHTAQFQVTGTAPATGGSLTNNAAVVGNEVDPVPGNNTASATARAVVALCEGEGLRLLGLNLDVANGPGTPCLNDSSKVIGPTTVNLIGTGPLSSVSPTVQLGLLTANTTRTALGAEGDATVASVEISIPALNLDIQATGLQSQSTASLTDCSTPTTLGGFSKVVTLTINGHAIKVPDGPATIALAIGNLYLNQVDTASVPNTIIHRALFLDLPGNQLDVVVAESKAGIGCTP